MHAVRDEGDGGVAVSEDVLVLGLFAGMADVGSNLLEFTFGLLYFNLHLVDAVVEVG